MEPEPQGDEVDMESPNRPSAPSQKTLYIIIGILVLFPVGWLISRVARGTTAPPPATAAQTAPAQIAPEQTGPPNDSAVAQFDKYTREGMAYYQKRDWRNAEVSFREALKNVPRSALGLNNLGSVLNDQGQFDAAIPYLELAVTIDPTLQIAKNNLAWARNHRATK